MSARYWVLCSHELMNSDPQWPEGLRPVKQADDGPGPPGAAWWLFEDDGASESLNGKRVELSIGQGGAVYGRRMVG